MQAYTNNNQQIARQTQTQVIEVENVIETPIQNQPTSATETTRDINDVVTNYVQTRSGHRLGTNSDNVSNAVSNRNPPSTTVTSTTTTTTSNTTANTDSVTNVTNNNNNSRITEIPDVGTSNEPSATVNIMSPTPGPSNTRSSTIEALNELHQRRIALDNLRAPRGHEINNQPVNQPVSEQAHTTVQNADLQALVNNNEAVQQRMETVAEHFQAHAETATQVAGSLTRTAQRLETLIITASGWLMQHPFYATFGFATLSGIVFMGFRFNWGGRILRFIVGPTPTTSGLIHGLYRQQQGRRIHPDLEDVEAQEPPILNPRHPMARYLPEPSLVNFAAMVSILYFLRNYR